MERRTFFKNLSALVALGSIRPGETISQALKQDENIKLDQWPKMTIKQGSQGFTMNIIDGNIYTHRAPAHEVETADGFEWIEPDTYSWGVDVELKLDGAKIDNLVELIQGGNLCTIKMQPDKYTAYEGNVIATSFTGNRNSGLVEIEFKGSGAMDYNYKS